ncbi:MAG: hypothetical protein JWM80_4091 [Cyanobacteria bacterium RYN_339]|nr:hypothetical protein [Cyanobacteria bacterium RYN_339]
MILTIKGTGKKNGEIPVGMAKAKEYFSDLGAFVQKIEDVETVKPLGAPLTYLVTDKPIGAFNYYVTIVSVLVGEWHDKGMTLSSRDFDTDKIKSEHQVLKGFIEGELVLADLGADRTGVDLSFTMTIEFPLPGALRLMPQALVKSTSDGIMSLKMGATVEALYKKVLNDFQLAG